MRLTTIAIVLGVVVFVLGASQPAVIENTEERCTGFYGTDCEDVTTYEPNEGRGILMGFGGFLFSAGVGGYLGARDAETTMKIMLEEQADE